MPEFPGRRFIPFCVAMTIANNFELGKKNRLRRKPELAGAGQNEGVESLVRENFFPCQGANSAFGHYACLVQLAFAVRLQRDAIKNNKRNSVHKT